MRIRYSEKVGGDRPPKMKGMVIMATSAPAQEQMATIKTNFSVSLPLGLIVELEKHAAENGMTAAQVARTALAEAVGYDLPPDNGRGRTRKHVSDDERKRIQREKSAQKRAEIQAELDKYRREAGLPVE